MNESSCEWNGTNLVVEVVSGFASGLPPDGIVAWPSNCCYFLPFPERSTYAFVTDWIWKTVPFILLVFGTVGNILSALVISRHFRKTATTPVYLLSLAVADTIFLYTAPLQRWIYTMTGFQMIYTSNWSCKIITFLTYASFHISAWILVAVTAERTVSVIWPYKVRQRCTQRNEELVTFAIVLAVVAMDSHLLYGFGTSPLPMYRGIDRCMPIHVEYGVFFHTTWTWIHFVFGFAVPFVFIVFGNTLVIHGLRKMRKNERWMEDPSYIAHAHEHKEHFHHHHHHHHHAYHAKTVMMILVLLNTVFFISQTPLAVYLVHFKRIMNDINNSACKDLTEYMAGAEKLWFWEAITHNFGYLNASLNFVLYVVSGSRFREEIKDFLLCRENGARRGSTTISNESSRRMTLSININLFSQSKNQSVLFPKEP